MEHKSDSQLGFLPEPKTVFYREKSHVPKALHIRKVTFRASVRAKVTHLKSLSNTLVCVFAL